MNRKLLLLFFGMLMQAVPLQGEAVIVIDSSGVDKHSFDRAKWESLTRDIDYSDEKPSSPGKSHTWNFSLGPELAKTILFTGIAALLIYLLYKTLKGNFSARNKKIGNKSRAFALLEEESIHEMDLEKSFRQALSGQNYREAIRIKYLMAIRELSKNKLILWKKDKTNHDYLSETFHTAVYSSFADITLLFERFWYGEADLNEQKFNTTLPVFDSFLSSLASQIPIVPAITANLSNTGTSNE
ncbi:MAG TPA: hypothetical protein PLU53_05790 [Bacteroidia bacterium]|nr:hypothetical protein [Bacteroidia bacterium]